MIDTYIYNLGILAVLLFAIIFMAQTAIDLFNYLYLKDNEKWAAKTDHIKSDLIFGILLLLFIEYNKSFLWFGLTSGYIIMLFVYSYMCKYVDMKRCILNTLIVSGIYAISAMLTETLFFLITSDNVSFQLFNNKHYMNWIFVQKLLICAFLFFSISIVIHKWHNRTISNLTRKEKLIICGIYILSSVAILLLLMCIIENNNGVISSIYILIVIGIILVICAIMYYILLELSKRSRIESEYKELEKQYNFYKMYIDDMKETEENARRLRHDSRNHLGVLALLIEEDKNEEALKYLNEYMEVTLNKVSYIHTNNEFVNAIIHSKMVYCSNNNITLICTADNNIKNTNNVELCGILGNLIDNAIEACNRLEENRIIEIRLTDDGEKINIFVKNRINESVLKINEMLVTSKQDKSNHGLGIKIVKSIVQKHQGYVDFFEKEGYFYCIVEF